MSKRDITPEQAAALGLVRTHYTVAETAYMTGVEYEGCLRMIKDGRIPHERFGREYRVPAWWFKERLTGESNVSPLAARRTA